MPKKGNFDNTYILKLKEINISLLEDFNGAKRHHLMKCDICSHEWKATPLSKLQNYKRHGNGGCPECTLQRNYFEKRQKFLQDIQNVGFEILTLNYDGNREPNNKILVKNLRCGHQFETRPKNILSRNINCPVCNKEEKIKRLNASSKQRSEEFQQTASDWDVYRHRVYMETRRTYNNFKSEINPDNLPRGKAGVDGAYHLDHIVPVRYCFDNNIPVDICAHYSNLQMLEWSSNVGSRDKLKEDVDIPLIFGDYI